MDYGQALNYLNSFGRFRRQPGLDGMKKLMRRLGDPQESLRCVHIAGTNGKGSVAVMVSGILQSAGVKTGLTVSPYVVDFRERFQLNGRLIPEKELISLTGTVADAADRLAEEGVILTGFEIVTAVAFLWFYQSGCGAAVLETGLGGRFDATNVISSPEVSVITSIGYDHTDILGDTLGKIAFEKCGIMKPGGVTVVSPGQDPEALSVIMEQAAVKANRLILPGLAAARVEKTGLDGTGLTYGGLSLHIPFPGKHQIKNALTAVETARQLSVKGFPITEEAIRNGIRNAFFPARQEVLCRAPLVILDGSHNPQGIAALADTVSAVRQGKVTVVMGMMKDKDTAGSVKIMAAMADRFYAVTVDNPRSLPAPELVKEAAGLCPAAALSSPAEILPLMEKISPEDTLILCGSLYLAGEIRSELLKKISNDWNNMV